MKQKIISIIRNPDPTFEANDYIPEPISDTEEEIVQIVQDVKQEIVQDVQDVQDVQEEIKQEIVKQETTNINHLLKPSAKKIIKKKKNDDNIYDNFLVQTQNQVVQEVPDVKVPQLQEVQLIPQVQVVPEIRSVYDANRIFISREVTEIIPEIIQVKSQSPSSTKPVEITVHRSIKKKKRGN